MDPDQIRLTLCYTDYFVCFFACANEIAKCQSKLRFNWGKHPIFVFSTIFLQKSYALPTFVYFYDFNSGKFSAKSPIFFKNIFFFFFILLFKKRSKNMILLFFFKKEAKTSFMFYYFCILLFKKSSKNRSFSSF